MQKPELNHIFTAWTKNKTIASVQKGECLHKYYSGYFNLRKIMQWHLPANESSLLINDILKYLKEKEIHVQVNGIVFVFK